MQHVTNGNSRKKEHGGLTRAAETHVQTGRAQSELNRVGLNGLIQTHIITPF